MLTHIISTRLPKLSEEQVTTKIQKTHELLLDVLPSDKQAKGKIETFFVSKLIWYSAFCIDGDVLFLSPYEQERGLRIESPVTEIDLKAYPGVGAWLRDEIERLMGSVVHRKHASSGGNGGVLVDKHERVFLGLGSNKDDRASNLLGAINALKGLSGTTLVACSAFVETEPWGVIDQPRFLNAVVEIRTALEPFDLLSAVKRIERELDRQPTYRWGPRKIDIDILVYGRRRVAASDLTIPHQHATQRDFVMSPLSEIAPEVAARLVDGTWIK